MSQIYKNSEGFSYKYPENHPIVSILYLLITLIVSYTVFATLGMFIGYSFYGADTLGNIQQIMSGKSDEGTGFLKIFLAVSSIGTFIVPAFLLKVIEKNRTHYLDFSFPRPSVLLWLTLAIMLVANPFLELTSTINREMALPEFLSEIEAWMKMKELEMEKITASLLQVSTIGELLINIVVIAVIPAIGEELFFRGCLQPIFHRWFRNAHLAIWLTAIIFSAIHIQFYGFIPRVLMGAAFGYMLYWGKSIWLPILAHFVNNAFAVVYTFIFLKQGKTFDEINNEATGTWPLYIISFLLLLACFYLFRKQALKPALL